MIKESLNIAVLPAGQWGSAFAMLAAENGHHINIYFRTQEASNIFNKTHQNHQRLEGIFLPENIYGTHDLEVVKEADLVVLAPSSRFFRSFYREVRPFINVDSVLLSLTKGIEEESLLRMSQIIEDEDPDVAPRVAVLSGPNFAKEIAIGLPAATVIASADPEVACFVQRVVGGKRFRPYTSADVTGVEMGGALKNVIAIAAGVSDGLNMGISARSSLVARGLEEIKRLGTEMGADAVTFDGQSGIGDLVASCSGQSSRNYLAGFNLGIGASPQELLDSNMTTEGLYTVKAAAVLAEKYGVEMPITQAVHSVLYEDLPLGKAIKQLMERQLTKEHRVVAFKD